jgi:hypothetical protein
MSIPSRSDKVAAVICLPEYVELVVLGMVMLFVSCWKFCPPLDAVKLLPVVVHEEGKMSATSSSASTLIRRCNRLLPPPPPPPPLLVLVLLVRGDELENNSMFVYITDPRKCVIFSLYFAVRLLSVLTDNSIFNVVNSLPKQMMGQHNPLLGNGAVSMFPQQQMNTEK